MRLLHWNIHMWRDGAGIDNRNAVAEMVRNESPDVVSLVEVDEPAANPAALRDLADREGYTWLFVPAFEYRNVGGFGNALLIRGEVHAVQQWELLAPRIYDGTEPSEQRTILLARVTVDDLTCWVGSTHFPRRNAAERAAAARRLLHLLGEIGRPWVVCGDFNQPADWLPSHLAVAPDPPTSTHPTSQPVEAIDYCVADGFSLAGAAVASRGSDHLPILVTATPLRVDGSHRPHGRSSNPRP